MPNDVMKFLGSGAFVCIVTGKHMRSVALDEAIDYIPPRDRKRGTLTPFSAGSPRL